MDQKKKGSVLARIFRVTAQGKGILFFSCASYALGMVSGIVPYLSVYFIVRALLLPGPGMDVKAQVMGWIVVAGISILCNMLFTFLGSLGCHRVAFRLLYNFRMKVMSHLGALPMGFFNDSTTGSIQKTMDESIEKIEGFIAHMLPDIIGSLTVVILLFAGLFRLSGWLAATVLLALVAALAFQMLVFGGKQLRQLWADVAKASQTVTGAFAEYVKGMAEVKLFGLAGTVTHALEENIDRYRTWELRQYKRSALPMSAYKTIGLSLLTFVLPAGILLMRAHPGPEAMLAVLMALIPSPAIYDPLMTCINYGAQMGQLSVGLDTIDEILDHTPIAEAGKAQLPEAFDVCFEDVCFSYQDAADPMRKLALRNISLTAPQGKMTALVGPSGGGKSTIGQLLSRFWDIDSGAIRIGGIDIRTIRREVLMDLVATVLQDTYIFADTLVGNITMNRPYSQAQVEQAARAACCHDFITRLPNGYETRVGTGGARLSGGEAQRLSIARAILKGLPIVVLDEALAYSDAENENLIQQAIQNLVRDKTVIIIAHRLQSIREADQILVLEQGEITERGTHEALMAAETEYRTLWNLQHQADEWAIDTGAAVSEGGRVS